MKNILLVILKIAIILVIIIVFTIGFNHEQDIDDFAYAVAIGIDSGDSNNLKVHFQFTRPSSSGGEGSGGSGAAQTYIYTVDASSVSSAINLVNNYISKQINLSHCKVLVISEELAYNKGIEKEVYTLINDVQLRPDTGLIISICDSKYFIENSKPTFETLVSKYYEIVPATTEITGYTAYIKISDFFNQLKSNFSEPCAILRWCKF